MGALARRILVAVVAIPIAVGAGYVGELVLASVLSLLAGLGAWELFTRSVSVGWMPQLPPVEPFSWR